MAIKLQTGKNARRIRVDRRKCIRQREIKNGVNKIAYRERV
jgi:hypothetical protein